MHKIQVRISQPQDVEYIAHQILPIVKDYNSIERWSKDNTRLFIMFPGNEGDLEKIKMITGLLQAYTQTTVEVVEDMKVTVIELAVTS